MAGAAAIGRAGEQVEEAASLAVSRRMRTIAGRHDWQHPPAPQRRVTSATLVTPTRASARIDPSVVPVHAQTIMS